MPFFNCGAPFAGPGSNDNLLLVSPYVRGQEDSGFFPPPGSDFMITETLDLFMIDESGDFMITE